MPASSITFQAFKSCTSSARPVEENPAGLRKVEPAERSFVGVGLLVSSPLFIMVRGNSPHTTLRGFLEAARRPGARVTYANSGVGSTSHLAMEMFMQGAGITIEEVGYRGGGPAIQAMLAGETDIFCLPAAVDRMEPLFTA